MRAVVLKQQNISTITNLQSSFETAIAAAAPNWRHVVSEYMKDVANHCSEAQPRTARPQIMRYAPTYEYVKGVRICICLQIYKDMCMYTYICVL